jgi:transglutaminase-like putative cysteine protease
MRRTAVLYLLPAALVVANWLHLEERPAGWPAIWIALLALLPALARQWRARIPLAVAGFLLALHSALSVSVFEARPFDGRHDFFGPLLSRFGDGLGEFYEIQLPFSGANHSRMHGVVLLAVFAFCLLIALAISGRRPVLAGLALAAGAGWPATLLPTDNDVSHGALILVGVLVLMAGLRRAAAELAGRKQAFAAGTLVLTAAVAASSLSAVARGGLLDWEHWNLYNPPGQVGVRYVWDSDYSGIRFPKKRTTVLRIEAPATSLYWRATTLDEFKGSRWTESLVLERSPALGFVRLGGSPALPARARTATRWIEQHVTVEALNDRHLVGASVPVAYQTPDIAAEVEYDASGIAVAPFSISRGATYTVWSYAPQPRPVELARVKPSYPVEIAVGGRHLGVDRTTAVPAFGSPGREARMRTFFAAELAPGARPYRALYEQAQRVVGDAGNPYAAVVALESWFRSGGGFHYDERPPRAKGAPPLVDFVSRTRRGYCQHFAGAMALMLRYLGIPSRVAAGFSSGQYDRKTSTWTVTDHEAHTWVEVWFPGYGWLPFDPTPGRGLLSAGYTSASARFDRAGAVAAIGGAAGRTAADRLRRLGLLRGSNRRGRNGEAPAFGDRGNGGMSLVGLLALLLSGSIGSVAAAKLLRRRARYLTRDPRRLARACRLELVEFLRDQRVEVPPSATLREVGEAAALELEVDPRRFVAAGTAARFAPPDIAAGAAGAARRELRTLERLLRRRLSGWERFRGLLSLRSFGAA